MDGPQRTFPSDEAASADGRTAAVADVADMPVPERGVPSEITTLDDLRRRVESIRARSADARFAAGMEQVLGTAVRPPAAQPAAAESAGAVGPPDFSLPLDGVATADAVPAAPPAGGEPEADDGRGSFMPRAPFEPSASTFPLDAAIDQVAAVERVADQAERLRKTIAEASAAVLDVPDFGAMDPVGGRPSAQGVAAAAPAAPPAAAADVAHDAAMAADVDDEAEVGDVDGGIDGPPRASTVGANAPAGPADADREAAAGAAAGGIATDEDEVLDDRSAAVAGDFAEGLAEVDAEPTTEVIGEGSSAAAIGTEAAAAPEFVGPDGASRVGAPVVEAHDAAGDGDTESLAAAVPDVGRGGTDDADSNAGGPSHDDSAIAVDTELDTNADVDGEVHADADSGTDVDAHVHANSDTETDSEVDAGNEVESDASRDVVPDAPDPMEDALAAVPQADVPVHAAPVTRVGPEREASEDAGGGVGGPAPDDLAAAFDAEADAAPDAANPDATGRGETTEDPPAQARRGDDATMSVGGDPDDEPVDGPSTSGPASAPSFAAESDEDLGDSSDTLAADDSAVVAEVVEAVDQPQRAADEQVLSEARDDVPVPASVADAEPELVPPAAGDPQDHATEEHDTEEHDTEDVEALAEAELKRALGEMGASGPVSGETDPFPESEAVEATADDDVSAGAEPGDLAQALDAMIAEQAAEREAAPSRSASSVSEAVSRHEAAEAMAGPALASEGRETGGDDLASALDAMIAEDRERDLALAAGVDESSVAEASDRGSVPGSVDSPVPAEPEDVSGAVDAEDAVDVVAADDPDAGDGHSADEFGEVGAAGEAGEAGAEQGAPAAQAADGVAPPAEPAVAAPDVGDIDLAAALDAMISEEMDAADSEASLIADDGDEGHDLMVEDEPDATSAVAAASQGAAGDPSAPAALDSLGIEVPAGMSRTAALKKVRAALAAKVKATEEAGGREAAEADAGLEGFSPQRLAEMMAELDQALADGVDTLLDSSYASIAGLLDSVFDEESDGAPEADPVADESAASDGDGARDALDASTPAADPEAMLPADDDGPSLAEDDAGADRGRNAEEVEASPPGSEPAVARPVADPDGDANGVAATDAAATTTPASALAAEDPATGAGGEEQAHEPAAVAGEPEGEEDAVVPAGMMVDDGALLAEGEPGAGASAPSDAIDAGELADAGEPIDAIDTGEPADVADAVESGEPLEAVDALEAAAEMAAVADLEADFASADFASVDLDEPPAAPALDDETAAAPVGDTTPAGESTPRSMLGGWLARLDPPVRAALALVNRPLQYVPAGWRTTVDWVAISLAFWVPITWILTVVLL